MTETTAKVAGERADILELLRKHSSGHGQPGTTENLGLRSDRFRGFVESYCHWVTVGLHHLLARASSGPT